MSLFLCVCCFCLQGVEDEQEGSNDGGVKKKQTQCHERKVTYNVSKESGEAFDSRPFSYLCPFNLDYKKHKHTVTAVVLLTKNAQGQK